MDFCYYNIILRINQKVFVVVFFSKRCHGHNARHLLMVTDVLDSIDVLQKSATIQKI
jgi:hypothetical protein